MAGGQNTFVSGNVLTAAQVNSYLMDQALMRLTSGTRPTAAAQGGALQSGMAIWETDTKGVVVYNGSEWVNITGKIAIVTASETTSSATYTDLATAGPSVTVATGATAICFVTSNLTASTAGNLAECAIAVSGATTVAAPAGSMSLTWRPSSNGYGLMASCAVYITGLTPGNNTFKMQYRSFLGGVSTYAQRAIQVVGVP